MAKKQETEASNETDAEIVNVRVTGETIFEDGEHRAKGAEFPTTAKRAAALGALVEAI